jgi:dihydrofolate reductase
VATGIATARELAGSGDVTVASASIAAQALDLGLLDEVRISFVPVLLGKGIPYSPTSHARPITSATRPSSPAHAPPTRPTPYGATETGAPPCRTSTGTPPPG